MNDNENRNNTELTKSASPWAAEVKAMKKKNRKTETTRRIVKKGIRRLNKSCVALDNVKGVEAIKSPLTSINTPRCSKERKRSQELMNISPAKSVKKPSNTNIDRKSIDSPIIHNVKTPLRHSGFTKLDSPSPADVKKRIRRNTYELEDTINDFDVLAKKSPANVKQNVCNLAGESPPLLLNFANSEGDSPRLEKKRTRRDTFEINGNDECSAYEFNGDTEVGSSQKLAKLSTPASKSKSRRGTFEIKKGGKKKKSNSPISSKIDRKSNLLEWDSAAASKVSKKRDTFEVVTHNNGENDLKPSESAVGNKNRITVQFANVPQPKGNDEISSIVRRTKKKKNKFEDGEAGKETKTKSSEAAGDSTCVNKRTTVGVVRYLNSPLVPRIKKDRNTFEDRKMINYHICVPNDSIGNSPVVIKKRTTLGVTAELKSKVTDGISPIIPRIKKKNKFEGGEDTCVTSKENKTITSEPEGDSSIISNKKTTLRVTRELKSKEDDENHTLDPRNTKKRNTFGDRKDVRKSSESEGDLPSNKTPGVTEDEDSNESDDSSDSSVNNKRSTFRVTTELKSKEYDGISPIVKRINKKTNQQKSPKIGEKDNIHQQDFPIVPILKKKGSPISATTTKTRDSTVKWNSPIISLLNSTFEVIKDDDGDEINSPFDSDSTSESFEEEVESLETSVIIIEDSPKLPVNPSKNPKESPTIPAPLYPQNIISASTSFTKVNTPARINKHVDSPAVHSSKRTPFTDSPAVFRTSARVAKHTNKLTCIPDEENVVVHEKKRKSNEVDPDDSISNGKVFKKSFGHNKDARRRGVYHGSTAAEPKIPGLMCEDPCSDDDDLLPSNETATMSSDENALVISKQEPKQSTPILSEKKAPVKSSHKQLKTSARKMPNYAAIHQKALDKLESLGDLMERKKARAMALLSGSKVKIGITGKGEKSSKQLFANSPALIPKRSPNKLVNEIKHFSSAKSANIFKTPTKVLRALNYNNKAAFNTPVKSNNKENIKSVRLKGTPSYDTPITPGKNYRRHLTRDQTPAASKAFAVSSPRKITPSKCNAPVIMKPLVPLHSGVSRFGFHSNNDVKDVKAQAIKAVTTKARVPNDMVKKRRDLIKGVRSNRRFDLLMEMRNRK